MTSSKGRGCARDFRGAEALRNIVIAIVVRTLFITECIAGPQHWGSGYPYLIALQSQGDKEALVAFEGPLRCKDADWIARWVDTSNSLSGLVRDGIACGDFWPGEFGTEYLAGLVKNSTTVTLRVLVPPEVFSTKPWKVIRTSRLEIDPENMRGVCAGDVLGRKSDQLLVLAGQKLFVVAPPATPSENGWKAAATLDIPKAIEASHIACGDFWGEGKDYVAVGHVLNRGTFSISYYEYDGKELELVTADSAKDIPAPYPGGFLAADFTKDGFDTLTIIPQDRKQSMQIRVAPRKNTDYRPSLGPLYNGRAGIHQRNIKSERRFAAPISRA